MERARKTSIIGTALRMDVRDVLQAFSLAGPYATGKSGKARLANQQDLALALLDWAITESDRGDQLLKGKAEEAYTPKGDGHITIGGGS